MANDGVEAAMRMDEESEQREKRKEDHRPALTRLSEQARRLVEENIGLVGLHLEKRVPTPADPRRDREYRDLFQEGCLALVRAAAAYDVGRDGPFAAYAILRIRRVVYEALHDKFSLMHLPARRHVPAERKKLPPVEKILQIPRGTILTAPPYLGHQSETLRHRLHRRYERALRLALHELKGHSWRSRDPSPILERIVAERLLLTQECMRTSLRQIARDFGISSGRAADYERHLIDGARQHLRADPQLPVLLHWMKEEGGGFDEAFDEELPAQLERAEDQAFHTRFLELTRPEQATLICDLIDRSHAVLAEVARNLHRMVRSEEAEMSTESLCA